MARLNAKTSLAPQVFVDTAGWLALLNARDGLHTSAVAVAGKLQRRVKLTTDFVLIEVADAFAAPPLRALAVEFYRGLRLPGTAFAIEIVSVIKVLLSQAWTLYGQRLDKAWGLTDCTSLVVMQEQGITEAFTSEHHFAQAGFTCLL